MLDRLINLPRLRQRIAQVVVNLGVIGPDAQRRFVERDGFRIFLLARQRIPQVVERVLVGGIDLQGHPVVLHRLRLLSQPGQVEPEIVVGQVVVSRHLHGMPEERRAVPPESGLAARSAARKPPATDTPTAAKTSARQGRSGTNSAIPHTSMMNNPISGR